MDSFSKSFDEDILLAHLAKIEGKLNNSNPKTKPENIDSEREIEKIEFTPVDYISRSIDSLIKLIPPHILNSYKNNGIEDLYDWQVECLNIPVSPCLSTIYFNVFQKLSLQTNYIKLFSHIDSFYLF